VYCEQVVVAVGTIDRQSELDRSFGRLTTTIAVLVRACLRCLFVCLFVVGDDLTTTGLNEEEDEKSPINRWCRRNVT